jgi:predicted membrane protein DUF2232
MLKYSLTAVLLGALSALLYLSVIVTPGGVIMASFTQAPLFIAGLSLGLPAALMATAVASVSVMTAGGLLGGIVHALVNALPVLILLNRALLSRRAPDGGVEWYPPGLLVAWLSGLAAVTLGVLLTILAMGQGGMAGSVHRQIDLILPMFGPNQESLRPLFEIVAPILPAIIVAAWMLVTMANGAIAQAITTGMRRGLRPALKIAETELPNWLAIALVIAAGVVLLGHGLIGTIAANATVILLMPFVVLGLAVVHLATRGVRARGFLLGGLYAVTAILTWPLIVIIALGLIEQGFGLKRRIAAAAPGGTK